MKKWVIGALIAVTSALFVLPGTSMAHTTTLSGEKSCLADDGSWSVEFTVKNNENQTMTITWAYIEEDFRLVPFASTVPPLGSTSATMKFASGTPIASLIVESSWPDQIVHGAGIEISAPTKPCVITICSNGELVTGTTRELADLPRTGDCGDKLCEYDSKLAATDKDCAPPPVLAEACVDIDGDGKGDEFQIFPEADPPAGAILVADGDACTPVTPPEDPEEPVDEVQGVSVVAEVMPVALPHAGSGGFTGATASYTGLAGVALALIAGSGAVALVARRR